MKFDLSMHSSPAAHFSWSRVRDRGRWIRGWRDEPLSAQFRSGSRRGNVRLLFETLHDFGVRLKNPFALVRARLERPVVVIEGAAEHDAVVTGKHIACGQIAVINLGLRYQNLQLSAHGPEFLVAKQSVRAEAGAVKNNSLRQAHHLMTIAQL